MQKAAPPVVSARDAAGTAISVLWALSFAHLLNDTIQSLVPAIYPIVKEAYHLDFTQIGLITFTFQLTACVFQPLVGMISDHRPIPYSTVAGMGFSLAGLVVLGLATSYLGLILGAGLVGTGSSIFHPESTRMARVASGGRHGFAQSVFQVGGQVGSSVGPLLAAFLVVPFGQRSIVWFSSLALVATVVLKAIGDWYRARLPTMPKVVNESSAPSGGRSRGGMTLTMIVLTLLMLSKSAYSASFSSFYTFYLIDHFHVSVQTSQILLFVFLLSAPLGVLVGGHVGDLIGRRNIIWFSILGALPFTLVLPYVGLTATVVLSVIIGVIMSSAFPAILVFAIDLMPGRLGLVAGVFYGLIFGLGALSAAFLGQFADATSIETVFRLCSYLPLLGLLTWFLPERHGATKVAAH